MMFFYIKSHVQQAYSHDADDTDSVTDYLDLS